MTAAAAITPTPTPDTPQRVVKRYTPYGGARQLFYTRDVEVGMDGPAGTGKSTAALEKMHAALMKYPGCKWFVARKTLNSLKSSTLATYRDKVVPHLIASGHVHFWSARGDTPAHYAYANGSVLVPLGLDKPGKAMSTEYDGGVVDEATDCAINDIETLKTRLRNGVMPYQQIILCFNPQGPSHPLYQRMKPRVMEDGTTAPPLTTRIFSRHEDNPRYFDPATGAVTQEGSNYLAILDALTGVRRDRLRYGRWVAAEGSVYEEYWDVTRNLLERRTICTTQRTDPLYGDCGIPRGWPRYLAVDFGYNHPFVAKWFAEDDDGRLYGYREIYETSGLVEDHAKTIAKYSQWGQPDGDPLPRAIICDHDAEGRATLERHLGGFYTTAADKRVLEGIQAVQSRLLPSGDGRSRLFELKDSLVHKDQSLADRLLPCATVDEYDMYMWHKGSGSTVRDEVVKDYDHGMDATRYMVAYKDLSGVEAFTLDNPW